MSTDPARGRWLAVLPAIGVKSSFLTGRNGPCPLCGGKDRWRFLNTEGNGTWICNQCGSGNGYELVKRFLRVEFYDALLAVKKMLRENTPPDKPCERDYRSLREQARRAWETAGPLCGDDPASAYLKSRGIELPTWPKALRYSPGVMLGKIVTSGDEAINLHRTFIPNGPKKFMAGKVPNGSAIRLLKHVGALGIAEGIETALSAYLLFGTPTWAACHAHGVETFTPPKDVHLLCIFADNDESCTGQAAAWTAAKRLRSQGLTVGVKVPEDVNADWNDVLQGKAH